MSPLKGGLCCPLDCIPNLKGQPIFSLGSSHRRVTLRRERGGKEEEKIIGWEQKGEFLFHVANLMLIIVQTLSIKNASHQGGIGYPQQTALFITLSICCAISEPEVSFSVNLQPGLYVVCFFFNYSCFIFSYAVINIANRQQIALTWALCICHVISSPGVSVSNNLLPNLELLLLYVF